MTDAKTLDVTSQADAQKKVTDVKIVGNTDLWQLINKASSANEGWMKSTKAFSITELGVVVQVSTQQNGSVAEALVFVPGAVIVEDANGNKTIACDPGLL